jgi:hypothetical protein
MEGFVQQASIIDPRRINVTHLKRLRRFDHRP